MPMIPLRNARLTVDTNSVGAARATFQMSVVTRILRDRVSPRKAPRGSNRADGTKAISAKWG